MFKFVILIQVGNWLTMNDFFYVSLNHHLADSQGGNSHGYSSNRYMFDK